MQNKKYILIGILIIAIFTRFAGIQSRPIWYDESFSILFAEKGIEAILQGTISDQANASASEEHPPIYYILLSGWLQLFGSSIISARTLSILFSLFSLFFIYKITEIQFNIKTALYAGIFFAVLPFQIHFAQEIRMYAMLSFWLLLATFSFLKAKENKKWWIIFSISSALAQYTHNLAAIYLIPLAFTPIFQKDWKTLRALILAGLAAVILYTPWLIQLPAQLSKVNSHYWVEKPGIEKIFTLILFYLPHLPLSNLMLLVGLLCAVFVVAIACFQTYLAQKNKIQNAKVGLWFAYMSFAPPFLLWVISQYIPIYIERALLPSHAIFCIWLAWSLTEIKPPRMIQFLSMSLIGVCVMLGLYQHITYKDFPYGAFKEINISIQNQMQSSDVVIHSSKLSYLPSFYFDRAFAQGFIVDPPGSTIDTLAPATRTILEVSDYEDISQATANAERIWFIIYQSSILEYSSEGNATHPHLEYLNENFAFEHVEEWDDIRVFLYKAIIP